MATMTHRDYPEELVEANHVEPAPRRVRGFVEGTKVFDTTSALYVWEWSHYPQYYIPMTDVAASALESSGANEATRRGRAQVYGLKVPGARRPNAAKHYTDSELPGVADTVRFQWEAIDEWLEEDERIFVHPRSPYVRVDALRSTRQVRIHLDGVLLADSPAPVMVFETGLPTRYYLDRTAVRFDHLLPSDTVTECPYKGTASDYWSIEVHGETYPDLVWSYPFPTPQLLPIAGLLAFYNEHVDIEVDGVALERPKTHFSSS